MWSLSLGCRAYRWTISSFFFGIVIVVVLVGVLVESA